MFVGFLSLTAAALGNVQGLPYCHEAATSLLTSISLPETHVMTTVHTKIDDFTQSKPSINWKDGKPKVMRIHQYEELDSTGKIISVNCKFKSPEALGSLNKIDCRELNQVLIDNLAEEGSMDPSLVLLGEDLVRYAGFSWVSTPPELATDNGLLTYRSPRMMTPSWPILGPIGGVLYCKLLPPYLAVDQGRSPGGELHYYYRD